MATAKIKGTRAVFREEKEFKGLDIPEIILIGE